MNKTEVTTVYSWDTGDRSSMGLAPDVSEAYINEVRINDIPINVKVTKIKTNMILSQCFCSCSIRCAYDYHLVGNHWITVEEHYPDCPNADPERLVIRN